jgi:response regulator RpfG family c-di-GMP phosphodiesterase
MYYFKSVNSENLKSKSIEKLKSIYEENYDVGLERITRLKNLANEFASWLGMRKNETMDLCSTMELSDIGKVAIDKKILGSENPLESMKTHCRIGYKIASLSYETSHLARIILNHHEHWDGSGFPQGLKGNEIPFLSRIVSIIEFYDDIMHSGNNENPGRESAINEIEARKGSVFDPSLADEFIKFLKTGAASKTIR